MPAIVRDLDDDAAIILMVDANLQRESILPSERAFAYKMKLDAIKHQGQRTDLTPIPSWDEVAGNGYSRSGGRRKQKSGTPLYPSDRTDSGTAGYGRYGSDQNSILRWSFPIWQVKNRRIFFLQWIMLKQLLPFRKHSELKSSHRRASVRWMRCARYE